MIAEAFTEPRPAFGVYGMAVDEARDLLWACTYDDTLPPAQPAHLKAFDRATGAEIETHAMPRDGRGGASPDAPAAIGVAWARGDPVPVALERRGGVRVQLL